MSPGALDVTARHADGWEASYLAPAEFRARWERLAAALERSGARTLVYSSCNAASLATDLEQLPSWEVERARLFDMFPQTRHHEVTVLLRRR